MMIHHTMQADQGDAMMLLYNTKRQCLFLSMAIPSDAVVLIHTTMPAFH